MRDWMCGCLWIREYSWLRVQLVVDECQDVWIGQTLTKEPFLRVCNEDCQIQLPLGALSLQDSKCVIEAECIENKENN